MNEWIIEDSEDAVPEREAEIPPAVQPPNSRRLVDPIAHAWRSCNPLVPLPRQLRAGTMVGNPRPEKFW